MAPLRPVIAALVFALAISELQLSNCEVLNAKLSCLDCSTNYDFSGIKVLVKCDQVQKMATTFTNREGSFEVEIPKGAMNCQAKLLGGPVQLYASRDKMVSKLVQPNYDQSTASYTISTPLAFYTECPLKSGNYCKVGNGAGSSKTIDLPLPREWGLAPSSYYIPFFPIIGIP